jgi:hypothetical protein
MELSSKEGIIKYLENHSPDYEGGKYFEWSPVTAEFDRLLVKVGQIRTEDYQIGNEDYWGEDAPIDFSKYPYARIGVYKLEGSNNLYFKYLEQGGHGGELRARLIRKELIV